MTFEEIKKLIEIAHHKMGWTASFTFRMSDCIEEKGRPYEIFIYKGAETKRVDGSFKSEKKAYLFLKKEIESQLKINIDIESKSQKLLKILRKML